MKKNIIVLLSLFCIVLIGCSKINPNDITIIDGIRLGTSVKEFYNQCDSLKIAQKAFYTKIIFSGIEEIGENQIKAYTTDLFNFNEYGTNNIQHYGLYYPTTLTGTKNVIGLNVLLVHTSIANSISNGNFYNLGKETLGISQDISYSQVDDIASMLSKKYGKPVDTLKHDFIAFYAIEGNQIWNYYSDSTNFGEKIIWKTKYLDISLFKGISSPNYTFNSKQHTYSMYLDNNPFRQINFIKGERPCCSYSYISYVLNDIAIKKLDLDKTKL